MTFYKNRSLKQGISHKDAVQQRKKNLITLVIKLESRLWRNGEQFPEEVILEKKTQQNKKSSTLKNSRFKNVYDVEKHNIKE